jgi:NADPH-dependent curcumin reductase CurA
LEELDFDAAFNYKEVAVADALRDACPDGIDIYFENVGGEHLECALARMNLFGRVALCGLISQYNATEAPRGPANFPQVLVNRLLLKGFIISDHFDRIPAFLAEVGPLVASGKLKYRETVIEGIENAPSAFIGLLSGENFGKMLVKVGPGPTEA